MTKGAGQAVDGQHAAVPQRAPLSSGERLAVTSRKSLIDFRTHLLRAGGDEAARIDFQRMISALVGATHPTATDVRPDPGDWGIDVFVGQLIDRISIWQSKYFYTSIGNSQKAQIRDSFDSAMKHASKYGYEVEAWTLCVACELSAPERRWWDNKVKKWQQLHPNLSIDLWDAPRLRRLLLAPEAVDVVEEFYPGNTTTTTVPSPPGALPISTEETPDYSAALFVRQLRVAGLRELDSHRAAYFNADLLVRDVEARAVAAELSAVREIDLGIMGHWEDAVADPATAPTVSEYEASAKRLLVKVMDCTRNYAAPPELPVRAAHVKGLMHRAVEEARAGWVHDWREVARRHATDRVESTTPAIGRSQDRAALGPTTPETGPAAVDNPATPPEAALDPPSDDEGAVQQ